MNLRRRKQPLYQLSHNHCLLLKLPFLFLPKSFLIFLWHNNRIKLNETNFEYFVILGKCSGKRRNPHRWRYVSRRRRAVRLFRQQPYSKAPAWRYRNSHQTYAGQGSSAGRISGRNHDVLRSAAEHELRAVGRWRQAVNSDEAFAEPASQHCRREQNKVRQKVIFNLEIFISEVKPSFTLITVS